ELLGGHRGAQHGDAVQGGFGSDLIVSAFGGEAGVGDPVVEVLAHRVLVDDLADRDADGVGADGTAGVDAGDDRIQEFGGRVEQLFAFAGAFGRQCRVAAGDQPLTGVVGVSDLGQILLVEKRPLQGPVFGRPFAGRGVG